jgi:hypothetical protein
MPKINVYVSDDLAERVRAAGISVSPVCQRALEEEVRKMEAGAETYEIASRVVERWRTNRRARPELHGPERRGYKVGLNWARNWATPDQLRALGTRGVDGPDFSPVMVGPEMSDLYAELVHIGPEMSHRYVGLMHQEHGVTDTIELSPLEPFGRGVLQACNEVWLSVQELLEQHDGQAAAPVPDRPTQEPFGQRGEDSAPDATERLDL